MIDFNKYFIVGTNSNALHDTMNGLVIGELIHCKDCKYYRDGDCWHEWDNAGRIYYQSIINEPNPDDYCSRAERKDNGESN